MIRHRCDLCRSAIRLPADEDPDRCEECDAVMCATCAIDGCCRAVPAGADACASCDGSGWSNPGGPCSNCCGTCVVRGRDGEPESCPICSGRGQDDFRTCCDCDGHGFAEARLLQRRSA